MFGKKRSTVFAATMLLALLSLPWAAGVEAAVYDIDPGHSTIGFAVKHLQVGTTRGGFGDYTGKIEYDESDLSKFNADVVIQAKSIDTKLEARDNHLRNPDFLDTDNNATITFKNAKLEKRGEGTVIVGDLTIRGVTKSVTIPVTIAGPVKSPFGADVIGINGQTRINRQDFGVSWNKALDNGGFVVDDWVDLVVEIEASSKS